MSEPVVIITGYTIVPTVQVLDGERLSPPIQGDNGGPLATTFVHGDDLADFVKNLATAEAELKAHVLSSWEASKPPPPNRATRRANGAKKSGVK